MTGEIPDFNLPEVRSAYTIFDVRAGGGKSNGVALDDAAVADVAAKALAHAAGGGKAILYFPVGAYLLSAPIDLAKSNVVVDGEGSDSAPIKRTVGPAEAGRFFRSSKPAFISERCTLPHVLTAWLELSPSRKIPRPTEKLVAG